MKNKKGSAEMVMAAVAALAIIVTVIYSYNVGIGTKEAVLKQVSIQGDTYLMSNALGYGKLFLEESLKLSDCQALFDYGMQDKYWYRNNDTSPSLSDFEKALAEPIKQNLNKYTSKEIVFFNSKYKPKLPQYNSVTVSFSNDSLAVKAKSNQDIVIEKELPKDKITLRKKSDIGQETEYKLFAEAKGKIEKVKAAHRDVESFIQKLNSTGSASLEGCENRDKKIEDLEVFNSANSLDFKDWNDTEKLEKQVAEIFKTLENTTFFINTNQLTVTPDCAESIKDSCSENSTYSYTKVCEFSYNQTLEIKFSHEGELCQVFTENRIWIKPLPLDFSASITVIHEPLSF